MEEIQQIIAATTAAYERFAVSEQSKDVREMVGNAVRFLHADLTSAYQYAAGKR